MKRAISIGLTVILVGCSSPQRRNTTKIGPSTDNPYPKGSSEWSSYEFAHLKSEMTKTMSQDLEATNPTAARKFRQKVALSELKEGVVYNFGAVGMPDRTIEDSGSPTVVYVYEDTSNTTHLTVDKETQIVVRVVRYSTTRRR